MENIQRILRELIVGDFNVTVHAWQRMQERSILRMDISQCARTVRSVTLEHRKCVVRGFDCTGEALTVVCVWDGETLVITAF